MFVALFRLQCNWKHFPSFYICPFRPPCQRTNFKLGESQCLNFFCLQINPCLGEFSDEAKLVESVVGQKLHKIIVQCLKKFKGDLMIKSVLFRWILLWTNGNDFFFIPKVIFFLLDKPFKVLHILRLYWSKFTMYKIRNNDIWW